jgi:hypothetical protein
LERKNLFFILPCKLESKKIRTKTAIANLHVYEKQCGGELVVSSVGQRNWVEMRR